ncbi:MAG TPA: succinate dehydrogenase assembly factor 2 [Burkholderiales bacterium]|jgi:antitoxin CptB|nr:succinate dehydrogenase assembly factor 2 [Burkholderiales bacterium]
MDRLARNRLQWKCRRGLLELDLVFERFLKKHPSDNLPDALLDLPDNDLWDIVIGRSNAFEPHLNDIVARLRAA